MNMTNKMRFISTAEESAARKILLSPVEASKVLPDWYKDLGKYKNGESNDIKYLHPTNDRGSDGADVSTKACPPFLDAMMSGYMYLLEDDLHIDLDENERPLLSWSGDLFLIDIRPSADLAVPNNCHPIQFGFKMNWYYQTPPGYSLLITHPMNRFDLPFQLPSGIVDADIWGLPVFIPFFIKKDFIGTIKKGTPVLQMIPIKREKWELEIDYSDEALEEHVILEEKRRSHLVAHYKKTTWQKKQY